MTETLATSEDARKAELLQKASTLIAHAHVVVQNLSFLANSQIFFQTIRRTLDGGETTAPLGEDVGEVLGAINGLKEVLEDNRNDLEIETLEMFIQQLEEKLDILYRVFPKWNGSILQNFPIFLILFSTDSQFRLFIEQLQLFAQMNAQFAQLFSTTLASETK